MKPFAKFLIPAFALLPMIPTLALPQGRWDGGGYGDSGYGRIDSRDDAYRAGYDEGYRQGFRLGRDDMLDGRRYSDKFYELDRFGYGFNPRFRNDFRKGLKTGYKEGYREAYRGHRGNRWY